jgi:hypothetical protein
LAWCCAQGTASIPKRIAPAAFLQGRAADQAGLAPESWPGIRKIDPIEPERAHDRLKAHEKHGKAASVDFLTGGFDVKDNFKPLADTGGVKGAMSNLSIPGHLPLRQI